MSDMSLRLRVLVASCLIAVPAALAIYWAADWLLDREMTRTIQRLMAANLTQHVKDQCESDPQWFLAGPREAPPTKEERAQPDAEVRLPRPSTAELPIEFYAYSEAFEASSSAAPRFPAEFRAAMRTSPPSISVTAPFPTKAGEGIQMARLTGWTPGPCAILLMRLRPAPHQTLTRALLFLGIFVTCFAVAMAAAWPMAMRIRVLALAARASAAQDYSGIATVKSGDEIGSLGAVFNEAAADIRRRIVDSKDREEALRRYVATVTDDVAGPLGELERQLTDPRILRQAHALRERLLNLAAAARLRTGRAAAAKDPVDMNAVVNAVVQSRAALTRALGVTLTAALPAAPAVLAGDPMLFERAVVNLVDNAVLYNQPGGRVSVEIARYERGGRFSLRVVDTGPGVTDEQFAALTAIRRFRGDENRFRQPDGPGLGLAVTREIVERYGFQLELRRPAAGGFEAEIVGQGTRS